jgi:DNA-binding NarL/FixJ family response regulator
MAHQDNNLNIVIADSQFLTAETLKSVLADHFTVKKCVSNKEDLFSILNAETIDALLIDPASLDLENFLDLKGIRNNNPGLAVVVITNTLTQKEIKDLNSLGIRNILSKLAEHDELLLCISESVIGKKYYSDVFLDMLFEDNDKKAPEPVYLTSSEVEIVRMIAKGMTTKEIAKQKYISFHTVMTHRRNILRKLDVSNASELIMYAISSGLIDTIEYHI